MAEISVKDLLDKLKIKNALRTALLEYENTNGRKGIRVPKGDALKYIARRLVHFALNSKDKDAMMAIKELADRLDGKPVQAIAGPDGEPITVVKRIIVQNTGNREIDVTPDVSTIEGESVENTSTKH